MAKALHIYMMVFKAMAKKGVVVKHAVFRDDWHHLAKQPLLPCST